MPQQGRVRNGVPLEECRSLCSADKKCKGLTRLFHHIRIRPKIDKFKSILQDCHMPSRIAIIGKYFHSGCKTEIGLMCPIAFCAWYVPKNMIAQQVPVQVWNFEEEKCGVKCGMKKSQPIAMFSTTEQSQAAFGELFLFSPLAKLHPPSLSWINSVFF